jgi:hypothetical protein
VAAGADGIYAEIHPEPASAPSDGANMLPLDRLEPLLEELLALREAGGGPDVGAADGRRSAAGAEAGPGPGGEGDR